MTAASAESDITDITPYDLLQAIAPGEVIEIERAYHYFDRQQFRLPPGRTRAHIKAVSCRYEDLSVHWTDGSRTEQIGAFETFELSPDSMELKHPDTELISAELMDEIDFDDIIDLPMENPQ